MADMKVWKDIEGERVARKLIKEEKEILYGYELIDIRFLLAENLPAAGGCKQFVRVKKLGNLEAVLANEVPRERGDEGDDRTITPVYVITRPYPDLLPFNGGDKGLQPVLFHALRHINVTRNVVVGHGRDGGYDEEVERFGVWRAGLELPFHE